MICADAKLGAAIIEVIFDRLPSRSKGGNNEADLQTMVS